MTAVIAVFHLLWFKNSASVHNTDDQIRIHCCCVNKHTLKSVMQSYLAGVSLLRRACGSEGSTE